MEVVQVLSEGLDGEPEEAGIQDVLAAWRVGAFPVVGNDVERRVIALLEESLHLEHALGPLRPAHPKAVDAQHQGPAGFVVMAPQVQVSREVILMAAEFFAQ